MGQEWEWNHGWWHEWDLQSLGNDILDVSKFEDSSGESSQVWISVGRAFEAEGDGSSSDQGRDVGESEVSIGEVAKKEFLLTQELAQLLELGISGASSFEGLSDVSSVVSREEDSLEKVLSDVIEDTFKSVVDSLVLQVLAQKLWLIGMVDDVVWDSTGLGEHVLTMLEVREIWEWSTKFFLLASEPLFRRGRIELGNVELQVSDEKSDWFSDTLNSPISELHFYFIIFWIS